MITIALATFLGFLVQEMMAIVPAIKQNEDTPNKFSFRYYLSSPANLSALVMNGAGTIGLYLAHSELEQMIGKIPVIGVFFEGVTMPVLTGLLVGFCGSYCFRWLSRKMV